MALGQLFLFVSWHVGMEGGAHILVNGIDLKAKPMEYSDYSTNTMSLWDVGNEFPVII